MSIQKGGILAMLQSTLITLNLIQQQLVASIQATVLFFPSLHTATIVDLDILHQNILLALSSNLIATKHISVDG